MTSSVSGKPKPEAGFSLFERHRYISYSIIIAIFILIGFAIYANTINAPFIYDDIRNITENKHIRMTEISIDQLSEILKSPAPRPVANLSFALNYYFDKYNPAWYHIVNILIHIATGILLFLFLKITLEISKHRTSTENPQHHTGIWLLNDNIQIAFLTALIWLVHPLNTQSVSFIVQRMNSMAAMFYILSFLCYIIGRILQQPFSASGNTAQTSIIKPWLWFIGCIISGILALASKQNAAMLPVFILLYEWFFFQDLKWEWLKKKLPWVGCAAVLFAIIAIILIKVDDKSIALYATQDFTMLQRLLTESRVLIYYISLIFYPHPSRLNLDYNYPISTSFTDPIATILCFVVIAVLLALSAIFAKKHRLLSFSILWFFGNLAVESSVIPLALIFEHRTYLPSMMVILFFVTLLFKNIKIKWISLGIVFTLIPLLSIWTFQRNMIWQDDIIFWHDCIKKSPNKANPYNNLAYTLINKNNYGQAIEFLKTATKLNPHYAEAHQNLGAAYQGAGNNQKAIYHYQQAIKEEPYSIKSYFSLGRIYYETDELQNAFNTFNKIIAIDPNNAEGLNDIGRVLKSQNKPDQALDYFKKAIKNDREFVSAYINCGALLAARGETDKARACYLKALALDPENVESLNNLGNLVAKEGRYNEAIDYYTRALKINPDHTISMNNMGNTLLAAKKYKNASDYYQKVLKITPDDAKTHNNLAITFIFMKKFNEAKYHFNEALRIDPENIVAKTSLNKINRKTNNQLGLIQKKLQQEPDNAVLHYQTGNIYKKNKDYEQAKTEYQTAVSLDPKFTDALYNLAIVYAVCKENLKSIETFKRILEISPDNSAVCYNISCMYSKQQNKEEAVKWLKKAVDSGYDNWEMIKTDRDLENIRQTNYFKQLIKNQ